MIKPDLSGRRILVVEDEYLLCIDICDQIEECGGIVLGPTTTLDHGHQIFQDEPTSDGGILNIRIGNHFVYPLVEKIIAAGVLIIFVSSESRTTIPVKFTSVPLVRKPVEIMIVAEHLFPSPS